MEQIEGLVTSKEIQSFEMITLFVREVFGTFFIEEGNWTFDEKNAIIGRTYFADRKAVVNPNCPQLIVVTEYVVINACMVINLY